MEVWALVLRHLSLADIGRVRCVCRMFHEICQEEYIWRHTLWNHLGVQVDRPIISPTHSSSQQVLHAIRTQVPWKMSHVYPVHTDEVIHGSWNPQGTKFASGSRDEQAIVFPIEYLFAETCHGVEHPIYLNHNQGVGRVTFNPTGELLLTATIGAPGVANVMTFVFVIRVSTQEMLCCLHNPCFDAFPNWRSEYQLLFSSYIQFEGPLEETRLRQEFSVVDIPSGEEEVETLVDSDSHPLFQLEGVSSHHLTLCSRDGNSFLSRWNMVSFFTSWDSLE